MAFNFFERYRFKPIDKIIVDEREIKIITNISKKKSSSITTNDQGIIISLSSYLSEKQKKEHFESLLKRFIKKKGILNNIGKDNFLEKNSFKFNDEEYHLVFNSEIKKLSYSNKIIKAPKPISNERLKKYIEKVLIREHGKKFIDYVIETNKKTYNFNFKEVSVKFLNSKWGHCTYDNRLLFNLKLLNAPKRVQYYVICHELSHIRHKNHSKEFWKEVEKFCSDYIKLRKYLKDEPPSMAK